MPSETNFRRHFILKFHTKRQTATISGIKPL
nr:MAG TPA: hypothetical protein [Caudoviricetes sp.]